MSLADTLNAARLSRRAVTIAAADFPQDEVAVIDAQNATLVRAGLTPGGWKAGPPSDGLRDAGCAPLAKEWTVASGASVPAPGMPLLIESEFVLRFGQRVIPSNAPYSNASIAHYIDAVAPGIELVWRRIRNASGSETALLYQADANGHAGLILGHWKTDWQQFDLSQHPVIQYVNGNIHAQGDAGQTMNGHPLHVAAALANREARYGRAIEPGCWVTTGSCTGALAIEPGDAVRSDYGGLGEVSVSVMPWRDA